MARETLQHDSGVQHEQKPRRLEGNRTRSLEGCKPIGIVMTPGFVVGGYREAGSFEATLEQASLKRRRVICSIVIVLHGLDCPLACEPAVGKGMVYSLQPLHPGRSGMTNELADGFVAARPRR